MGEGEMTTAATLCAVVFAIAAGANWWSRWTDDRRTELWSKPLALIALIGVAVTLDPVDPAVRAWFVVALVFSLAGDVFLLDGDRRFVPGLVAFLLAHVAYTIGLIVAPEWSWIGFGIGALIMLVLAATIGVRIVSAARRSEPVLGPAVSAYLVAISLMFCAAVATGNVWAIVGAGLFVASDSVLGWRQFVGSARWMPITVMVTYHLGQAGLVASLL
jgi:uncharacterized membrane protein YhhN